MKDISKGSGPQYSSDAARLAARLFFAATVFLIPVRYRLVTFERPIPGIQLDYTAFLLYASDVAAVLTLALWAASLVMSHRRVSAGPRYIWVPLAGLLLVGFASSIWSLDPLLSVYHAVRLALLFCLYLFVINEIRGIAWVGVPLGAQLVVQSVVASAQFASQHSIGLQPLGEISLDPAQSGVSIVAAGGVRLLRAYGLSDHPNILGGCLAFGMLMMLAAYLHSGFRWLAFAVLLPSSLGLIVTFSRSAWLAFSAGAALLLILDLVYRRGDALKRWGWLALACLILALPVLVIYRSFFGTRLNSNNSFNTPSVEQQSIGERLLLIDASASMIARRPLSGSGLGTAPLALKIERPDWPVAFEPPHAAALEAAVETGVPGALFYLVLLVAPVAACVKHPRSLLADVWVGAGLALLIAITIASLFDYYTWLLPAGRIWQWLAWGLWAALMSRALPVPKPRLFPMKSTGLII